MKFALAHVRTQIRMCQAKRSSRKGVVYLRSGRCHLPKQPGALRPRGGSSSRRSRRGRRCSTRRRSSGAVLALGRGRGCLRGGDGRARAHGGGSSTLARPVDELVDERFRRKLGWGRRVSLRVRLLCGGGGVVLQMQMANKGPRSIRERSARRCSVLGAS